MSTKDELHQSKVSHFTPEQYSKQWGEKSGKLAQWVLDHGIEITVTDLASDMARWQGSNNFEIKLSRNKHLGTFYFRPSCLWMAGLPYTGLAALEELTKVNEEVLNTGGVLDELHKVLSKKLLSELLEIAK